MRASSMEHWQAFTQATASWLQRRGPRDPADPLEVVRRAERWLAERPEDVETVQRLVLGATQVASVRGEEEATLRLAGVGLAATLVGALADPERVASAATLALLGAEAAAERAAVSQAHELLGRATAALQRLDAEDALTTFGAMKQHHVAAALAEASLERADAEAHHARALELARALTTNRRLARDVLPAWTSLLFGELSPPLQAQARGLLDAELGAVTDDATIGLARVSASADDLANAVRLFREGRFPAGASVLAIHDVVARLAPSEVEGVVADCLATAAEQHAETQGTWALTLRAAQAEVHLRAGDPIAAREALGRVGRAEITGADGVAVALLFAAAVRTDLARGRVHEGRGTLAVFLFMYAGMARDLAGAADQLPFRAACEPVLAAAIDAELPSDADLSRRESRQALALLLDALRAPETIPDAHTLAALLPSTTTAAPSPARDRAGAAAGAAYDRLGRLQHATSTRADLLVVVVQRLREGTLLLCCGGDDTGQPASVRLSAAAERAMAELMDAAERAVRDPAVDATLEALGRAAYDALPEATRRRLDAARTVLVVPDFGDGHDRMPFELLHDGRSFLGVSRVLGRCLSVAHALEVLEARLAAPRPGRRALCVAVARPPGLPPLRQAEEEIAAVTAALRGRWDLEELHESDATPGALLELAPLAQVLHVAAHGEASAGAEALVLGDGVRMGAADVVSRHRLANLVYLNACSLARGRYLGGGVSRGMAYAFSRAGARTTLANLLPVEDASAATLARAFYSGPPEETVGEALRRAREAAATSGVRPALWSATVLVGDPFVTLDGETGTPADATAALLGVDDDEPPARLAAARERLAGAPTDARLEGAIAWVEAMQEPEGRNLSALADTARTLGHPVGEARCLLALAEEHRRAGARAKLEPVLRRAVSVLASLRGSWKPAWDAQRTLEEELRRLDPTYVPRTLEAVRLPSGLRINDRSVPAIDAILAMQEAMDESETHWRGEPTFRVPDEAPVDVAWNAIVWGYRYRLFGTGAEPDYAAQCAARLVWRGAVPEEARTNVARVLGGVLPFAWGQQRVTHLDHWMARAHADVVRLLVESVARTWTPPESSPAAPFARELEGALEQAVAREAGEGSKFARARAALAGAEPLAARVAPLDGVVQDAVRRCHALSPTAAAELGAWSLGLLAERAAAAERGAEPRRDEAMALRALHDQLAVHVEGWLGPYLWEGFRQVRDTGGLDVLDRWRHAVL